jgi:predicted outer membrane repeat protein
LSGDIGILGDNNDNSYHVVIGSNTDNSAVLEGFTVTGANANGDYPHSRGGGMYNNNGSPSLTNVTFSGNTAGWGGGIYNEVDSNPSLTDVIFSGNSAFFGGGMVNDGDLSYQNGSDPILRNVIFSNNSAQEGGGMMNFEYSSPDLTNVTFRDNTAVFSGGGMVNHQQSNPNLTNVTFNNNSARNGGGMVNQISSSPTLQNVTFNNNSALVDGGGMANSDTNSSPILTNVTLSNNSASGQGGAIANAGNPVIRNSILWGNTGGEIFNMDIGVAIVSNSIVQGGYPGTGNLDADPLLGPLQDNGGFTQTMALLSGSPAIDAGNDASCPATDQRGIMRPHGAHCDIGAYEASVPSAATLVLPNGNIATNAPTYTWNEVSEVTWYYLWVNGPSGNVIKQWYTSAQANCNGSTCSVTPSTDLSSGAHTWWIQTWNSAGYGPWSSGMNFTPTPPGKAALVSPSGSIGSTTPTYTWNEVSGATWYYLWVNGPSGNVIKQWYNAAQAGCNGSTCSVTPSTILSNGAHTWWIQTWNSVGYGPWSTGMNFTISP